MGLAPGPFFPATVDATGATPGVYDFTADALAVQGQIQAITDSWGPSIGDMINLSQEAVDVDLVVDLDAVLADLVTGSAQIPLSEMSTVANDWTTADGALGAALSFAPAQAWSDPPSAYVPPDNVLTLSVPQINPNAFVTAPNTTVGANSGGVEPFVGLYNLTRVGALNFVSGDQTEVVILGALGADVTVLSTLNGESLPAADFGPIDSTGQMFILATQGPASVGVWSQQWFVGGVLLGSFNFIVSPS